VNWASGQTKEFGPTIGNAIGEMGLYRRTLWMVVGRQPSTVYFLPTSVGSRLKPPTPPAGIEYPSVYCEFVGRTAQSPGARTEESFAVNLGQI